MLAYNDAVFTDEDWTNIQKLKRSNKRSDPFKVGKFGIGFNSVFHVTGRILYIESITVCITENMSGKIFDDLVKFYKLQVAVSMLNEDTNSVVTSELELEGCKE